MTQYLAVSHYHRFLKQRTRRKQKSSLEFCFVLFCWKITFQGTLVLQLSLWVFLKCKNCIYMKCNYIFYNILLYQFCRVKLLKEKSNFWFSAMWRNWKLNNCYIVLTSAHIILTHTHVIGKMWHVKSDLGLKKCHLGKVLHISSLWFPLLYKVGLIKPLSQDCSIFEVLGVKDLSTVLEIWCGLNKCLYMTFVTTITNSLSLLMI